jgi:hypothetical protein
MTLIGVIEKSGSTPLEKPAILKQAVRQYAVASEADLNEAS